MRFKSVFGAIFFIAFACVLALILFIQTKSFGGLLTKILSDVAQKTTQTKVSIDNINLSFFPPGLELNRVVVQKSMSETEHLNAEFGKLGFYIGLLEIEEKKLTLGEIRIADSTIDYTHPPKNEELKEIDKKLIEKIFSLAQDAPIRIDTILVQSSKVFVNYDLLEVKRLKLVKNGKNFITRFHLANIKPSAKDDFTLDEVWGDAEIGVSKLDIHRLKIQHDVQTLLIKGEIVDYHRLHKSEASLNGEAHVYLKNLLSMLPPHDKIRVSDGDVQLSFNVQSKDGSFEGDSSLDVQNLKSTIITAETIKASLKLSNSDVFVSDFELKNQDEHFILKKQAKIYDIKENRYLPEPLTGTLTGVSLNNVLQILGPSLKPLKGFLTGNLTFKFHQGDLYFYPEDGFILNNLGLVVGPPEKPFQVIMVKQAKITESEFAVVKNELQLSTNIEANRTKLEVDGFLNSKELRFTIPEGKVNLEDLGNLAQLDVKGEGTLGIDVTGSLEDPVIKLKGKTKGFEILGYKLGETDKEITLELKDSNVIVNRMDGQFRSTHITGSGAVNYGNSDIALDIHSESTNYSDLSQILHPIFSKLDFLPNDLNFNARVDASIFGKTKLDFLRVRSAIKFTDLIGYGEFINTGDFTINMKNQEVVFENMEAEKGGGEMHGEFRFLIPKKYLTVKMQWENLKLSTFNLSRFLRLNIDGKISGSIKGEGKTDNYSLALKSRLFDTKSPVNTFEDSQIDVKVMPGRFAGSANFMGNLFASTFDYSLDRGRNSHVDLKVDVPDVKPLAVAFFGQGIHSEDFNGSVKFDLSSEFKDNLRDLDFKATLRELNFAHAGFNVAHSATEPQFLIEDGAIKHWDLQLRQPDIELMTKGHGNLNSKYELHNEANFNSKILEILLLPILSADGRIFGSVKVTGNGSSSDVNMTSRSPGLVLSIDQIPFPLNDFKYALEFNNNRLWLQEVSTSMENGSAALKGDIYFDGNDPDINLKYYLERAQIPILGKSFVNLSGEGTLLGNNRPYVLNGEIIVNNAQVINELTEFETKSGNTSYRFLPKNQESVMGQLITLNLAVKAENSFRVTNSLMDIALKGDVRLLGSPTRPRGDGRLFAPPNSSRIFFKNQEYLITNADINFSPKKDITNPDFDIQTLTFISPYKVYAKAYGDLERFNFDLSSEPGLARNSILSLIAFGYTEDTQLQQDQRENLNQVGVGSFVFDRFKISDILNKQFGLQVNLGTVFEQSSTSMLSGRSQDASSLNRTRSATKIELKKRLDEALSVSVSSTMGGGIGQRQRMDLTYNVNRKVQVQGIYEMRTNEEGVEDVIDNSIGGDLKFRWTFK